MSVSGQGPARSPEAALAAGPRPAAAGGVGEPAPRVSVCVPCYNCARHIAVMVEAVLANDYEDYELLLLEGGSTDGSAARVVELARRDPRIRALTGLPAGLTAKRNVALAEARGQLLVFLDDDRLPSQGLIRSYAEAAATWPSMMTGSMYCLGPIPTGRSRTWSRPRVWKPSFLNKVVPSRCGIGGNYCVPREVARAMGGWDERLFQAEDFDFNLRVLLSGRAIRFVPEAAVTHPSEPSWERLVQRSHHAARGIVLLMRAKYGGTSHGRCSIVAHLAFSLYALVRDTLLLRGQRRRCSWARLRGCLAGLTAPVAELERALASPRATPAQGRGGGAG